MKYSAKTADGGVEIEGVSLLSIVRVLVDAKGFPRATGLLVEYKPLALPIIFVSRETPAEATSRTPGAGWYVAHVERGGDER